MLHLIGMPRSGTRAVLEYLTDGMSACGNPVVDLNEPFNPYYELGKQGPKLELQGAVLPGPLPESAVLDRWQHIYHEHGHQDMVLKHVWYPKLHDRNANLMRLMLDLTPWPWAVLRRRDGFEQMLSWIIGMRTGRWHQLSDQALQRHRALTQPFAADPVLVTRWKAAQVTFEAALTVLQQSGTICGEIWYESIQSDCDAIGISLARDAWHTHRPADWFDRPRPGRVRKASTLADKSALISNLEEIRAAWHEQ